MIIDSKAQEVKPEEPQQASQESEKQNEKQKATRFELRHVYVKEMSFEASNTPQIFRETWQPQASLEVAVKQNKLEENQHEVMLTIKVSVKNHDRPAFETKAVQTGIFYIEGVEEEALKRLLATYCPTILFPYLREALTTQASKGGFPQFYLAPMNFDAIYEQGLKNQEKEKEKAKEEDQIKH